MVTGRGAVRDEAPATTSSGHNRVWWGYAVFGSLSIAAAALLPSSLAVLRVVVLPALMVLAAAIAVFTGVWRYRPRPPAAWLLAGVALTLFTIGDVIFGVLVATGRRTYPSIADAFYLAVYPLVAIGVSIGIARRRGRDASVVIDVTLVSVIAALVLWVYVIAPTLAHPGKSLAETLITVAYPAADLILFIAVVRLVVDGNWGARSLRYLVAGLMMILVSDVSVAAGIFNAGSFQAGGVAARVYGVFTLAGTLLIGLSAADPTMRALTEPAPPVTNRAAVLRLALLGAASLAPMAILALQDIRGAPLHLSAVIAGMITVSVLVVVRLWLVNRRAQRAARDEAALARCAADLLAAGGTGELYEVAGRTAAELLGPGHVELVRPPGGPPPGRPPAAGGGGASFTVPVQVRGSRVAAFRGTAGPREHDGRREALWTVARQLTLAIERDELLRAEQQTAQTLARQNEQLRELDQMKDRFVSMVSHELRTPLTAILGSTEMLLDGGAGELAAAQRQLVGIVDRNCRRLDRLVDDMLESARIESGRFTVELEPTDLAVVTAQQVEAIKAAARQAGVALELRRPARELTVNGDPVRLAQLCDNLLTNALKFTPAGGAITVTLQARGNTARLDVTDTGPGIPQDELPRLFARFFRASTAGKVPGTGLGLSIAKAIVEAHHGHISVRSALGAGTTFTVQLPLRTQPHPQTGA